MINEAKKYGVKTYYIVDNNFKIKKGHQGNFISYYRSVLACSSYENIYFTDGTQS